MAQRAGQYYALRVEQIVEEERCLAVLEAEALGVREDLGARDAGQDASVVWRRSQYAIASEREHAGAGGFEYVSVGINEQW